MKLNKYNDIPLEMKIKKRYLGWYKGIRTDKNGNEIVIKIPYSIVTGESGCWNKEENWATFDQAIENTELLGFVMKKEDGIVCIDLDDCYEDGNLKPFHKKIIEMFEGTYMELSQSGNGIHIFMKGSVPYNLNIRRLGIEVYADNHYIALTGNSMAGPFARSNILLDMNEKLNQFYEEINSKEKIKPHKEEIYPSVSISYSMVPSNGEEVLDTMAKTNSKASTLINGGSLTGDHSRDDYIFLSLARNYTHGNRSLMKEIFLKTGLNRMGTGEKRRSDIKYLEYLNKTIDSVMIDSYRPFDWTTHNEFMKRQKRRQVEG